MTKQFVPLKLAFTFAASFSEASLAMGYLAFLKGKPYFLSLAGQDNHQSRSQDKTRQQS